MVLSTFKSVENTASYGRLNITLSDFQKLRFFLLLHSSKYGGKFPNRGKLIRKTEEKNQKGENKFPKRVKNIVRTIVSASAFVRFQLYTDIVLSMAKKFSESIKVLLKLKNQFSKRGKWSQNGVETSSQKEKIFPKWKEKKFQKRKQFAKWKKVHWGSRG